MLAGPRSPKVGQIAFPHLHAGTAAALVGFVALAVFSNSLANKFAYDDYHIVVNNSAIHSIESLPGSLKAPYWPSEYGRELGLWRPATTGLLGLQYVIGNGAPWLFHAVNMLGHALSSVLVLMLFRSLMTLPAALIAGLIFAVHPVHVEAVANVVGISEILAAVAVLLGCLAHAYGPKDYSSWRRSFVVGALFSIGLGAKEGAITLPALIFLIDAARDRISFKDLPGYVRARWRVYVIMGMLAGAFLVSRYAILGSVIQPLGPLGADLLSEIPRIWTLADGWLHYVRLWVFPMDLSADYSPNVLPLSLGWHASNIMGAILALGILCIALLAWRRPEMAPGVTTSRAAAFGVVWFLIAIAPVSNTLFLSGVLLAERTMYLPSVGLAGATGWLVVRLASRRPRATWIFLVLLLLLSSVRTWTRTPAWRDNPTMFATMIGDYPHSGRSQWILGDEFLAVGAVSQGMASYRAAIGILGGHYQLLTEISKKLIGIGQYKAAEALLQFARQKEPRFPLAPALISTIRAELGDSQGTERFAREALELTDYDPARLHLLAWALAAQGRWEEAHHTRTEADEYPYPGLWQQWMYLAYVRRNEGNMDGALVAIDSAASVAITEHARAAIDSVSVFEFSNESQVTPN